MSNNRQTTYPPNHPCRISGVHVKRVYWRDGNGQRLVSETRTPFVRTVLYRQLRHLVRYFKFKEQ